MTLPPRLNAFANSPLDRAGQLRKDQAFLAQALQSDSARVCVLQDGAVLCDDAGVLWLNGSAAALATSAPVMFHGNDPHGAPVFAVSLPSRVDINDTPIAGLGAFTELRAAAPVLESGDLAIVGAAKALFEWHAKHGFCANCGEKSTPADAGWKRVCAACSTEHFPRVDPVVIMLPVHEDRCLLGRQSRFPKGMFSALAGFVEPGESIEEACARETLEEVGLTVHAARIQSSQPWPFPSSLMIGLICETTGDAVRLDDEIDETVWLTRDEARAALDGGVDTANGRVWAPPPFAIAHQILKAWVNGD